MSSTYVRNLASHVDAIAYSNFRPVPEKWNHPKKLSKGATEMIKKIKDVTGTHVKPIHSACLLNEDCSSQYYFLGQQ